jgi:hypothetical protein
MIRSCSLGDHSACVCELQTPIFWRFIWRCRYDHIDRKPRGRDLLIRRRSNIKIDGSLEATSTQLTARPHVIQVLDIDADFG